MLLSNPNRKSFSLSLNIPLTRSRPSKDHSPSLKSINSPSTLSSPNSPLLSGHVKHEQPILPVVTDGLDPAERMRLLKKSRKLSRILGEVPIPVSIEQVRDLRHPGLGEEPSTSTSASTSSSSSPGQPPRGIGHQNLLKRCATVSHNRFAQQRQIQRARSLASLRPSLSIPLPAPPSQPSTASPMSSVEFAWPQPMPTGSISPVSPSGTSTIRPTRRDSVNSYTSRRDSMSSVFVHERTPEQLQRARAAKLARQLGENIPPELLLRASSPGPRSPPESPSIMSFAEASLGFEELAELPVRRSSSTKRTINSDRSRGRRRLSLDVRTFVRGSEGKTDAPFLTETIRHRVLLKKSNSASRILRPNTMVARAETPRRQASTATQDSDVDSDLDGDPDGSLAAEKQRALNVRRARKMNQVCTVLCHVSVCACLRLCGLTVNLIFVLHQVFGNDPPLALFQITNLTPAAADEMLSVDIKVTNRRRDSRGTFVSVAPAALTAPEAQADDGRRNSEASSGENLSPLVFAEHASAPPTPQPGASVEGDDASVHLAYLDPSQPLLLDGLPASPLALPPTSPSQHSFVSMISSASHGASLHLHAPLTSPIRTAFSMSPPPFSNMFHRGSASVPTSPPAAAMQLSCSEPASAIEPDPSDPQFRTRRLRAAKLSRFFGVGLQDITGMLVRNDSTPSVSASASPAASASASASASQFSLPPPVPPVPPVPSMYELQKTESAEAIATPSSPTSARPFASSGAYASEERDSASRRSRTSSGGRRSQSATRSQRRPSRPRTPSQSRSVSASAREQATNEPEVPVSSPPPPPPKQLPHPPPLPQQQQLYSQMYSTTVEVAAESRGKYFFLENRRSKQVKELEMQAAIKQLRKIK